MEIQRSDLAPTLRERIPIYDETSRPAVSPPQQAGEATHSGVDERARLQGIEHSAWFDLNGDGQIQNCSAMLGGDGYLIGDGDGNGRLGTGVETWYDSHGRRVPPAPEPTTAPRPAAEGPHSMQLAFEIVDERYKA